MTFETASNLKKIKLFCFFAEFQTFRISNQPDSESNSLPLCKNDFFIENRFKLFFAGMGGKRVRACAGPTGPAHKNIFDILAILLPRTCQCP